MWRQQPCSGRILCSLVKINQEIFCYFESELSSNKSILFVLIYLAVFFKIIDLGLRLLLNKKKYFNDKVVSFLYINGKFYSARTWKIKLAWLTFN